VVHYSSLRAKRTNPSFFTRRDWIDALRSQ
jgi:hypothetical protein